MISAKTIDKAYEFYLKQPLASINKGSIIYVNKYVILTGLGTIGYDPHRHYTKEEFTEKINSDKIFKNFCLPKLDLNNLRNFQSKLRAYDTNHDSKEKIIMFSFFNSNIHRYEYFVNYTTSTGKIISAVPHRISNGFDRACLYNFIPTGKNSFSLFCFSSNEELGYRIFMRKLQKVLKEKFYDNNLTLENYVYSLKTIQQ